MFEIPEAKRVRREDIHGSDGDSNDSGSDDELTAQLNAKIAAALGLSAPEPSKPTPVAKAKVVPTKTNNNDLSEDEEGGMSHDDGEAAPEDDGYEFNLFSTAGPAARVILEDAEPQGDGGLVNPRPPSFYVATVPSAKERQQYEYAAVGADEILARSEQRSWGMEMPWKVREIIATRRSKPGKTSIQILQEVQDDNDDKIRKRPGKKQRILLRQRTQAKEQKAADAAKNKVEKEEHIKDKKKRLNRIKKLRKRAKEREKKLTAGGEAAAAGSDSDGSGGESAGE